MNLKSLVSLLFTLSSVHQINAKESSVIKGEYIVSFNQPSQNTDESLGKPFTPKLRNIVTGSSMTDDFKNQKDTLVVESDDLDIEEYRKKGAKIYLNRIVKLYKNVQRPAPWNLARINTRKFDRGHDFYEYSDKAGEGVDVYVIDTGIDIKHPEFQGRASFGASFIQKRNRKHNVTYDDDGHGTHVAGTVASLNYGVAKKANVIAVKVLGKDGSGTSFQVGSGILYAIKESKRTGRPSIINMSLGTDEEDEYIDEAIEKAIEAGVYVVTAAGNEDEDACKGSPNHNTGVIAVGALNTNDERADFSNYGECVAVFAPGVAIKSLGMRSGYETMSGTSMAAPHVAGALAVILSENNFKTYEEGVEYFKSTFSENRIRTKNIKESPNQVLFLGPKNVPETKYPSIPPNICSVIECYIKKDECDDCSMFDGMAHILSGSQYKYGSAVSFESKPVLEIEKPVSQIIKSNTPIEKTVPEIKMDNIVPEIRSKRVSSGLVGVSKKTKRPERRKPLREIKNESKIMDVDGQGMDVDSDARDFDFQMY